MVRKFLIGDLKPEGPRGPRNRFINGEDDGPAVSMGDRPSLSYGDRVYAADPSATPTPALDGRRAALSKLREIQSEFGVGPLDGMSVGPSFDYNRARAMAQNTYENRSWKRDLLSHTYN